jgi:hypothetical protein
MNAPASKARPEGEDRQAPPSRLAAGAVVALVAVAFLLAIVLRLRQAASPLSFDEFASLYFADRPFGDLWGPWMLRETNPPLFYSVLKLWRTMLPDSKAALRALPVVISLAQIGLLARLAAKTYGGLAAVLCILLFALSPSDLYQSGDIRGYGLAKLAVTISFIGLVCALSDRDRPLRGWIAYVAGALGAIYSHTTMLLWPPIATAAVLMDGLIARRTQAGITRKALVGLLIADAAILLLSAWEVWFAVVQLTTRASNIAWIETLETGAFASELNLQLLMGGRASSILMAALILVGLARTRNSRVTRLSLFVLVATIVAFRAADRIHPITSDFTLHWCASFSVLLAAAATARRQGADVPAHPLVLGIGSGAVLAGVTTLGLVQLFEEDWVPKPQDWAYTVKTVARHHNAALLATHESVGLVIEQACRLEFHRPGCPFPLVVMASPSRADSWSFGGFSGRITPQSEVRSALGPVRTVYAFSRYVYTPLQPLGLNPGRYRQVEWDDGTLIGPIPIKDFEARRRS